MLKDLVNNQVVIIGFWAWSIAQFLKFPMDYFLNKRWNWGIMFSSGGLPSSHSALVTAVTLTVGLQEGFDTAVFAVSAALAAIVIYDAAGVRRQAGIHAARINEIMKHFFESGQLPEKELKEMLGHTPFEVISGIMLGLIITFMMYYW